MGLKAVFYYKEYRDWALWKAREFTGANVHKHQGILRAAEGDMWMYTHNFNGHVSIKNEKEKDWKAAAIGFLKRLNEGEDIFDRFVRIEEDE